MIADTTFLVHYIKEGLTGRRGPARTFFTQHRKGELIRTSVISLGEVAVSFQNSRLIWEYFQRWTIYRLAPGVVDAAADIDRILIKAGERLGENDNWIAGFALFYREPVVSLDVAFDRVPGIRRIAY